MTQSPPEDSEILQLIELDLENLFEAVDTSLNNSDIIKKNFLSNFSRKDPGPNICLKYNETAPKKKFCTQMCLKIPEKIIFGELISTKENIIPIKIESEFLDDNVSQNTALGLFKFLAENRLLNDSPIYRFNDNFIQFGNPTKKLIRTQWTPLCHSVLDEAINFEENVPNNINLSPILVFQSVNSIYFNCNEEKLRLKNFKVNNVNRFNFQPKLINIGTIKNTDSICKKLNKSIADQIKEDEFFDYTVLEKYRDSENLIKAKIDSISIVDCDKELSCQSKNPYLFENEKNKLIVDLLKYK